MTFRRLMLGVATAALFLCLPSSALPAIDMFLKIEGIDGESTVIQYENWIEADSFSWGVANASSGGGTTTAKPVFGDLALTKLLDKASPHLFLACANGRHIPTVILVLRSVSGDGAREFFRIKLDNVRVSSSSIGATAADSRPAESLSLNYTRIEWTYTPTTPQGGKGTPVSASWDLATNTTASE